MSESESENESDLDFSASEDEYIPTEDESDDDESEDDTEADAPVIPDPKKLGRSHQKRNPRKASEDDDDSDSSVENYLVNPNDIDLASDFFNPNVKTVSNVPTFDCNIGLNLSDSDEEEVFDDFPSTSRDAVAKMLDFNAHDKFNKNLERAKDHLRNFKSSTFGQDNCNDVTKLLAIGEASAATSPSSKVKRRKNVMSSDESDFEEVEGVVKTDNKKDVEVRIGPTIKQKPDKHQAEIEASIKRRINRRKKENQLMMHKVHLLSWIAYGNFVNKVLNSTKLMEMVVKYIPSDKCYPKDKTDQQYFEQIIKWFLKTVGLKNKEQNCNLKCLPPLPTSLALQIQSKMAICKKDYLFIFIILLRSMGIQCRLVINLASVPIRPPAKDLCVISLKNPGDDTKKTTKSTKKKESTVEKPKEKNVKGKDTKQKSKGDKLKRGNSIIGQVSEITTETSEPSSEKKSLKSKLQAAVKSTEKNADKKVLKRRSVSVQDNNKLSRATNVNGATSSKVSKIDSNNTKKTEAEISNGTKKKILKRRSLSLQSPNISTKQSSNQPGNVAADVGVITKSPLARRTRRGLAKLASMSVPQFDGGDDTKNKKRNPQQSKSSKRSQSASTEAGKEDLNGTKKSKPNLIKIRMPSRSRSVSQSGTRSKSTAENKNKKKAKPNLIRIRLPSISRSVSRSPTSLHTSNISNSAIESSSKNSSPEKLSSKLGKANLEKVKVSSRSRSVEKTATTTSLRASRRRKFEDSMSKNPSTSPVKSINNSKNDSNEVTLSTAPSEPSKRTTKEKPSSSRSATLTKSNSQSTSPLKSSSVTNSVKGLSSTPIPSSLSNSQETGSSSSKAAVPLTSNASASVVSSSSTKSNTKNKLSKLSTSSVKEMSPQALKHKASENFSSDSDFAPTPKKKLNSSASVEKPLPKAVEKLKKRIDRRVLSTDDESIQPAVKKNDMNYWVEVYCEADSKWICIDLFKLKVNCVDEVKKHATKPIAYVFGWNNNNSVKDVSPRYCSQWNTTTRKLRVPPEWLDEALSRYKEPISQRCVAEDRELEEIHSKVPIPTSISELKNHPLYVLPRHLLKFEGIYPPNPVPVGYIRDEPIYSRLCVHTLHSREIWVKQARTVKPGEIPYKIVKARPKWDRLANKMLECQPLEIFGFWQTQAYEPPVAENGIVPRNAYGNVELFKPEMLPINTVHLRLPGLNRVCAKLKIDCAQAVVGFDFHGGSSHPTFDGFVVCEEFQELVTMKWWEEAEQAEQKSKEKQTKRVYDNWKKLIKGLLIRERLQRKYNFAGKDGAAASSSKKV